jgi:hypothetical protein
MNPPIQYKIKITINNTITNSHFKKIKIWINKIKTVSKKKKKKNMVHNFDIKNNDHNEYSNG